MKDYKLVNIYQGRLNKDDELISSLVNLLKDKNIYLAKIEGIGAVSSACLGYFDVHSKKYREIKLDENMEIVSLLGNVSLKDGNIFTHIHVVLSREDFSIIGGHLFSPTIVYAFEYQVFHFEGDELIRIYDEDTGLFLWSR
ncbi:MAG: DNA-binding protein [Thermodesulfovibrionales bacterium]|nr:DNA-binding protein [Thermodesulfovibrionales bacterium]